MNDRQPWFPDLDPPPGGERRLRLALRAHAAAPAWRWAPAGAAAALLLLALATWWPLPMERRVDDALREAWTVPEGPQVTRGHSRRLASGDPTVRLYAVTVAPAPTARP